MLNIVKALYDLHAKNIKIQPCHTNRASSIGTPCVKQLVYARTAWEAQEKGTVERQLVFDEGNLHERQIMIELMQAGFVVHEQNVGGVDEETGLSWHVDAIIVNEDERIPLEVKSAAPYIFDAIDKYSEKEFKKAMDELGEIYPWLKKYPAQLLTYLHAKNLPVGIIIFKNKSNGRMKQFEMIFEDHKEYFAEIVAKSKLVDSYADKIKMSGVKYTDPEFDALLPERTCDPDECRYCSYRFLCLPDVDFGSPLSMLTDEVLEKKISDWFTLAHASKQYKDLNDDLCVALKGRKNTIIGRFHIDGKESKSGAWLKKITVINDNDREDLEKESDRLIAAMGLKDKPNG